VYQFSSIREYINAVYLRGARMLDALRRDIGTDAFFEWMRRYAEAGADRVVTPDLFWSLLSPSEQVLTQDTREAYLSASSITTTVPEATSEAD
jgi:aminopeptidase N